MWRPVRSRGTQRQGRMVSLGNPTGCRRVPDDRPAASHATRPQCASPRSPIDVDGQDVVRIEFGAAPVRTVPATPRDRGGPARPVVHWIRDVERGQGPGVGSAGGHLRARVAAVLGLRPYIPEGRLLREPSDTCPGSSSPGPSTSPWSRWTTRCETSRPGFPTACASRARRSRASSSSPSPWTCPRRSSRSAWRWTRRRTRTVPRRRCSFWNPPSRRCTSRRGPRRWHSSPSFFRVTRA